MQLRMTLAISAALTFFTMTPAHGDWHAMGRCLGIGWSDGYHARNACPPKRSHGSWQSKTVPWWAIPAADSEPQPHPAASHELKSARSQQAIGPSLFRQPGEGTTVFAEESVVEGPTQ
jgi:hypothetical protein